MNLEDYVEYQNFNDATNIDNAKNSNVSLTEESIEKEKRIQKEKAKLSADIINLEREIESYQNANTRLEIKQTQYQDIKDKVNNTIEYLDDAMKNQEQSKEMCKQGYKDSSSKTCKAYSMKWYQAFYLGTGIGSRWVKFLFKN